MSRTSAEKYNMYDIKLKKRAIMSIYMNGDKVKNFRTRDNRRGLPKLYVVKSGLEIIYVGQTTRAIGRRLREGLQGQEQTRSYPYKWKHLSNVSILIWCFEGRSARYVETVEGEVVFLLRICTGKWPKYQVEIHFHNAKTDEKEVAEAILKHAAG